MSAVAYEDPTTTVLLGDCRERLLELDAESIHAVVTDPPYELGFMGKTWDSSGVAFDPATWATMLRVLKPGGHLLAFGGTRTFHRITCAIEDAGFEIRDCLSWLYGSGFPKSLDVSKAIDKAAGAEREVIGEGPFASRRPREDHTAQGLTFADDSYVRPAGHVLTAPATPEAERWQGWGTALKPAWEPIIVARKPPVGTVAANVLAHGTGAINVDGCRIPAADVFGGGGSTTGSPFDAIYELGTGFRPGSPLGRWPANVVMDEEAAVLLDEQTGTLTSGKMLPHHADHGKAAGILGAMPGGGGRESYGDSGGASRFLYVAKPTRAERDAGQDDRNHHPTVKPLELMRWLVRLVTPPGGTVLDPFAGSGTTAEACIVEGFRCVAIEREADYLPLIVGRISKPIQPDIFGATA